MSTPEDHIAEARVALEQVRSRGDTPSMGRSDAIAYAQAHAILAIAKIYSDGNSELTSEDMRALLFPPKDER